MRLILWASKAIIFKEQKMFGPLLEDLMIFLAQETAMFKAKKAFQKIEQAIRQAMIEGERIDVIEENLWERMLNLGRLMLTIFVAGQGTGDLGPTLEYEDRILKRLDQLHSKRYVSVFGALPPIERTVYGSRETQKHEVIPLDAKLGLPESEYSYLLQQCCQSFCVKSSYKDSQTGVVVRHRNHPYTWPEVLV